MNLGKGLRHLAIAACVIAMLTTSPGPTNAMQYHHKGVPGFGGKITVDLSHDEVQLLKTKGATVLLHEVGKIHWTVAVVLSGYKTWIIAADKGDGVEVNWLYTVLGSPLPPWVTTASGKDYEGTLLRFGGPSVWIVWQGRRWGIRSVPDLHRLFGGRNPHVDAIGDTAYHHTTEAGIFDARLVRQHGKPEQYILLGNRYFHLGNAAVKARYGFATEEVLPTLPGFAADKVVEVL